MQLYHFTDEQSNNLNAILIDNKDGFTDDQWKTVFHLLYENRLNDEQFGLLWICLTIQHRSCYYCMQVEEQEKLLLHVKSLLLLHVSNRGWRFALTTRPNFP
jgi:hypothetical protein